MAEEIDLTTVATAAAFLGVSSGDANLPRMITVASRAVARHLGYDLHSRTGVVEQVAGHNGPYLFLKAGQVTEIESITVDDSEIDLDEVEIESALMGRLRREDGWHFTGDASGGINSTPLQARSTGAIVVTFSAGWVTPGQVELDDELTRDLPEDIEQACLEIVAQLYRRRGQDAGVVSRSLGDASVTFAATAATTLNGLGWLKPFRKLTRRIL